MSLIIGNAVTKANVPVLVASVDPSLQFATGDILIINPNGTSVRATLYISTASSPASVPTNHVVSCPTIPGDFGEAEWTCKLVNSGENIFVKTDTDGCIVRVSLIPQAN